MSVELYYDCLADEAAALIRFRRSLYCKTDDDASVAGRGYVWCEARMRTASAWDSLSQSEQYDVIRTGERSMAFVTGK